MFSDPQTQIVVGVVLVMLVGLAILVAQGGNEFPYVPADSLLTPAERAFFSVLQRVVGKDYVLMSKVRLADLIEVKPNVTGKRRYIAFNKISAKHADFVLCEPETFRVLGVIELDDRSHREARRQRRDRFMDSALAAACIPILRVQAQRSYSISTVREQVDEAFGTAVLDPRGT